MKHPSPSRNILNPLLLFLLLSPSASRAERGSLSRGSSLSVEDASDILTSPSRSFACGFYNVGTNAYAFSIWFSDSANKTVAWTANRDYPVNGHGSKLSFRKDGGMILEDANGTVVWSTNIGWAQADRVQLLDIGNLVVQDPSGNILWQSFDSPTDTLLPTQPITKAIRAKSSAAPGSLSSGYYGLYFDNDNVLRLIYDGPEISSIYWPNPDNTVFQNGRTTYNSSRYAVLDEMGKFVSSDKLAFSASDMGSGILRRLTLDYDGNLRLYSLDKSKGTWSVTWEALPRLCRVHGLCGRNGICTYVQSKVVCSCPPHYEMSDQSDWRKGCKPKFNMSCNTTSYLELAHTDFWGDDVNYSNSTSLEACKKMCEKDCSCEGLHYVSGRCYPKGILFNGRNSPIIKGITYLRMPARTSASGSSALQMHEPICNATGSEVTASSSNTYASSRGKTRWVYFYGFISAFGAIEILFVISGWWFIFRRERKPTSLEEGYRLISSQFRQFTYKELKRATGKFMDEIGRGGSGVVYKGVLDDKRVVAVKKLGDAIQGELGFEMSLIGRIYHKNLVRIWGFCSEGPHNLLVTEYVANGSLDKHIFGERGTASVLGWSERFKIAVGVAQGLAYLHHECLEWVIHCDVKPENILLDDEFEPKIADFGLAKLSNRGGVGSDTSRIRGTRGYMAPEWTTNLPITAKVDVYSYGVVLLEMVKGSRVSNLMVDEEEEVEGTLKSLVRMLKGKLESGEESWVEEIVDSRLDGQFNCKQAEKLVEIVVTCLEQDRNKRPTMDSVVHTLLSYHDEHSSHEGLAVNQQ
ncbi:putative receptor protein kinase ZmPK1 [Elaeis guineensis]|uniref:Receptor-like serine/threonine-protein kinase n=1 Tax=Elaeis guineensis var. tenera TaxID=51953 RepID=A0A6I9RBR6_ELAGV|nr:putative receptor protein kinase ZmPK1 [Elaeis guineensis]